MSPDEGVPLRIDIGTIHARRTGTPGISIELDPTFTDPHDRPRWMEAVARRVEELNTELLTALDEDDRNAGWRVLQYIAWELYKTQSQLEILLSHNPCPSGADATTDCRDIARLSLRGGVVQTDHNGAPFCIAIDESLGQHPPAWLRPVMQKIEIINGELGRLHSLGARGAHHRDAAPSEDAWRTLQLLLRFLSRTKVQLQLATAQKRSSPETPSP